MGAPFTSLTSICIELVNASDPSVGLGVLSANQEWTKSGEFNPLFVLADAKYARLICNQKGLGARRTFLTGTQSGIASGGLLNNMVGPVEAVSFVVTGGRWAGTHYAGPPRGDSIDKALQELSIENRNVTTNPEIAPHFVQDGSTIFHNGVGIVLGGAASVSVNATFCTFTINFSASATQCPDEFAHLIATDALAMYFAKDGDKVSAASHFANLAQAEWVSLGGQPQ